MGYFHTPVAVQSMCREEGHTEGRGTATFLFTMGFAIVRLWVSTAIML